MLTPVITVSQGAQVTPQEVLLATNYNWQTSPSDSLCGVYAVCSALQCMGEDIYPEDYITGKYVGTCDGASSSQLVALIEDCGFSAHALTQLSIYDIRSASSLFIAFVRSSADEGEYNHWITVEPTGKAELTIYDSVKKPYTLSYAEFQGIWSGSGIFISRPGSLSPHYMAYASRLLLYTLIALAVFVLALTLNHCQIISMQIRSCVTLGALTLVVAIACVPFLVETRHFWNGVLVAVAPYQAEGAIVEMSEALEQCESGQGLLVDARREVDYRAGAIENSINVPVYAAREDIGDYFADLAKDKPIYIYCQSEQCNYDLTIAKRLASLGYRNVKCCRDGWYEYENNESLQNDAK